jgi:O-antigen/teichoic acid export membrane protein
MNLMNFVDIKSIFFENRTTRQTIFKNTFWLGLAMICNKLLTLAVVIYAARILGATEYGKFTFALAFVSLLMVFSDFGLSGIITREFAREKEKKEEFYSLLSLKILLILGTLILILFTTIFSIHDKDIQKITLILSLSLLINGLIGTFYAFFHSQQKMEYEAWLEILQSVLIFSSGLFILLKMPSAKNLSYAYSISAFLALISLFLFFHFKISPLKIKLNFLVWKKFLAMSWPLALMGIFGVIYSYTDSVMLGYWKMLAETGWYNAASKIAMFALVPTGLIAASFYPTLSQFSQTSPEKFQKTWNYLLEIMIFLAIPLIVGGVVLAKKIIYYFYPQDFSPSILVFQILILTAGIIIIYRPFYDAMIVLNQQSKMFLITLAGAITNVILNLILIPKYSLYGAAIATVITNLLNLFVIWIFLKKFTTVRLSLSKIFLTILVASIASLLMYLAIKQPLLYNINVFILVLIGGAIYSIVFFAIKKYLLRYLNYANN